MIDEKLLEENASVCEANAAKLPEISAASALAEGVCPVSWCRDVVIEARKNAAGKSVMCRDGLWQLQLMIEGCMNGQSGSEDLEVMKELLDAMEMVGCADSAKVAKIVKASLETYASEWDAHVRRHRCSALICYYSLYIDPSICQGKGECLKVAPEGSVAGGPGLISVIKDDTLLKTDAFIASCPLGAIKKYGAVKPMTPQDPVPVGSFTAGGAGGEGGGRRRRRRG